VIKWLIEGGEGEVGEEEGVDVVEYEWVQAGTHYVSVGGCEDDVREAISKNAVAYDKKKPLAIK